MLKTHNISLVTKLTLASVLAVALSNAQAEELGTIEVTATSNLSHSKVNANKINVRQANRLRDVMRDIPGVYVAGTNGFYQTIDIRNVNEKGLNITVDGARQLGDTFHHNGNLLIDPELLKKVDVSVGTNSVVDGQGALGGAVRFTTVDARDLLTPGRKGGFKLKTTYGSNNKSFNSSVAVFGTLMDKIDLLAYYNFYTYDFGKTPLKSQVGGDGHDNNYLLKGSVRFNDANKLTLSTEQMKMDGYFRFRANFGALKGHENNLDQEYTRRTHTLKYEFNPASELIDMSLVAYRTEHVLDRLKPQRNIKPTDFLTKHGWKTNSKTVGFKLDNVSQFKLGATNHSLRTGYEYYKNTVGKVNRQYASGKETHFHNESGINHSIYIEDAIRFGKFTVIPGLRFDHYKAHMLGNYNKSWSNLSKGLSIKYDITNDFSMYVSYTDLFRAPSTIEAIRLETSDTYKQSQDLDPEKGQNYEIGTTFSKALSDTTSVSIMAKFFHTRYKNLIVQAAVPGVSSLVERHNAGRAKSTGFEAAARVKYNNLSAGVGFSVVDTKLSEPIYAKSKSGKRIAKYGDVFRTAAGPKFTFSLSYDIPSVDVSLNWNTLILAAYDKDDVHKSGYGVSDFAVSWTPSKGKLKGLQATAGVYNIFNKAYISHTGNANDYEPGRNFKLSLSYKF